MLVLAYSIFLIQIVILQLFRPLVDGGFGKCICQIILYAVLYCIVLSSFSLHMLQEILNLLFAAKLLIHHFLSLSLQTLVEFELQNLVGHGWGQSCFELSKVYALWYVEIIKLGSNLNRIIHPVLGIVEIRFQVQMFEFRNVSLEYLLFSQSLVLIPSHIYWSFLKLTIELFISFVHSKYFFL